MEKVKVETQDGVPWPWIDCATCGEPLIHGDVVFTHLHYDEEKEYCGACCLDCNRRGFGPPDEFGFRSRGNNG